jgi:hypothetical protein
MLIKLFRKSTILNNLLKFYLFINQDFTTKVLVFKIKFYFF